MKPGPDPEGLSNDEGQWLPWFKCNGGRKFQWVVGCHRISLPRHASRNAQRVQIPLSPQGTQRDGGLPLLDSSAILSYLWNKLDYSQRVGGLWLLSGTGPPDDVGPKGSHSSPALSAEVVADCA